MIRLRHLLASFLSLVLLVPTAAAVENHSHELIVTATADTELARAISEQDVPSIFSLLAINDESVQFRSYVHAPLLDAIEKSMQAQMFLPTSNLSLSFLQRTFVLSTEIDSHQKALLATLQSRSDIEHIEFMPERSILIDCSEGDPLAANQYHLELIKALDAWAELSEDQVVIAIVDTGVDYLHEDLRDVIYENPGEVGEDGQGNDKRTNGIDDDNNGFVDDFRGWDMYHFNNHPLPGNGHGTHVAGIAGATTCNGTGVAGVFPFARIMPLKIGPDVAATNTWRGHEAILYAAYQGADVINCSWGGTDYSLSEHHTVRLCEQLGSFIVASAGNAGTVAVNYPAAYREVFSVANTDETDIKVGNSSYHVSVDVSAPGARILSTIPENEYEGPAWTGTSMSSPVVAGVAAMALQRYPHLSKQQLAAWLRTSVDEVYTFNQQYLGKLGSGRINAAKALSNELPRKAMSINNIQLLDQSGDGFINAGETANIRFNAVNHFDALTDLSIRVVGADNIPLDLIDQTAQVGPMSSGQVYLTELGTFTLSVPVNATSQEIVYLRVEFLEQGEVFDWDFIRFVVQDNTVTLSENDMSITITGDGKIGYADYPNNQIGDGLRSGASENVLFGGGVMIGTDRSHVSSAVFEEYNRPFTSSFSSIATPKKEVPGERATGEAFASFADGNHTSDVGVTVNERLYQYADDKSKNRTIIKYNVTNTSGFDYENVYCGLFFDADFSPTADEDVVQWASEEECGIFGTPGYKGYPIMGMIVASPHEPNFVALENFSPNSLVVDGQSTIVTLADFSIEEKWDVLRAGTAHGDHPGGDLSTCLSAGPFELKDGESEDIVFVVFFADSYEDLFDQALQAKGDYARVTSVEEPNFAPFFSATMSGETLVLQGVNPGKAHIHIVDILGNIVTTHTQHTSGNDIHMTLPTVANGTYIVRYSTDDGAVSQPITIVR